MDHDELRHRQKVRVVLAEIGMVIAVLTIVTVTVLATMGFNVNRKGEVEQSGLMQLHTMPTGATINLDGETLFARTNTSRTLSQGEHWLELSRDGYDKWEKAIKMQPGHLMRLYYPRLFLQNRPTDTVAGVDLSQAAFYQVSNGRNYLIYGDKKGQWQLVDIKGDQAQSKTISVKSVFTDKDEEIEIIPDKFEWSKDESRVLVRAQVNGAKTWAVINFNTLKESVNITKLFSLDFTDIQPANNSVMHLWAFENGNIHRIDVGGPSLSGVLVDNVADFTAYEENLIYATKQRTDGKRAIGFYQNNAKAGLILKEITDPAASIKLAISNYYDEDYLAYMVNNHLNVWGGQFADLVGQMGEKEVTVDIASEKSKMKKFTDADMSIIPNKLYRNNGGEYLVGQNGNQFISVDLDTGDYYQYDRETDSVRWIDDDMMYGIKDGRLLVWDFDGWNTRELAQNVDYQPILISKNDKFIYYVSQGKLVRMQILE